MYQRVRRSRGAALLLLPALATALAGLGPSLATRISWAHVIPDHTAGIVTPDLAWGILAAFPLVGILLYSAAIEPDDAGLDAGRLLGGLGMVVMLWAASQVIGALPRVVAEQGILPHPDLMNRPFLVARRALAPLPAVFRDGLVFRGFLLPQLYLLFHRDSAAPRLQGMGRALVISQVLALLPPLAAGWAGLSHLGAPALIQQAGLLLGLALFLAWIYIRTGNLFFTMGVHLLVLSPIPLFAPMIGKGPWIQQAVVVILAVVWTALWKGEK